MKEIIIYIRYAEFHHKYYADIKLGEKESYFSSDSLYHLMDIVKINVIDIQQELLR